MKKTTLFVFISFVFTLFLAGCSIDITRNEDGSLQVESQMAEEALQSEINRALADQQMESMTVTLQNGLIQVVGERPRAQGDATDILTFDLTLGVAEGGLTAVVANPQLNGIDLDPARTANWNARIAERLERLGQRRPNSTLESVTVTSDAVLMSWRVEPQR
jgi:hypothetical protein